MASNTLVIKELVRTPQYGPEDKLEFQPGVNIIVGPGNSGKTRWLNMLDYLLGDAGKTEDAFPQEMVEKYDTIGARLIIDGVEYFVERRWKEKNAKGKVFIDGNGISAGEFQQFLLDRLKIPILHYPKGNPYDERAWPELSWRTMYRHIYRQQRFWSDIADKQTETEQHAVLMLFLGIAEHLFSNKSGKLVEKRKELWKALGAKEQYLKLLDRITREVSEEKEIQIAITPDMVALGISRLNSEIENLQTQRDQILEQLQKNAIEKKPGSSVDISSLGKKWAKLNTEKNNNHAQMSKLDIRLAELDRYRISINNEIQKMERARKAGQLLVDIKVTHCPVCDQPVKSVTEELDHCYLCGQSWVEPKSDGIDRIDTEIQRLKDEKQEVIEVIRRLSIERDQLARITRTVNEEIQKIDIQLAPLRQATASIMPPEIGVIDMEKGRLHERIRQLERINIALSYQNQLSTEIDDLTALIGTLEAEIKAESSKIRFAYSSDLLATGMNTYVSSLKASGKSLWKHDRILVSLKEKGFNFAIEEDDWKTKLGGTSYLYFLLAYHYGLINLSHVEDCHYPGLLILDLPATLIDGSSIQDKENFIAEPFIRFVNKPGMRDTQVILTGQAFDGLEGVNRISLTKVWQ